MCRVTTKHLDCNLKKDIDEGVREDVLLRRPINRAKYTWIIFIFPGMLPVMRDRSTEKTMISETFAKGFEKEMNSRFKGASKVEDEDYIYMYGLINGAHICGHMNSDDLKEVESVFSVTVNLDAGPTQYIKIVKNLSKRQHED